MDGAFWQRYEQVEAKTYKTFEVKEKVFGVDPKNRRLGGVEAPPPPQAKRTIKIKSKELEDALPMDEQAVLQTGKALILSERSSKDDFNKAVQVAYSAGKGALTEPQRNAVALVAWSMGLDPSPGVGHLYAWSDGQGFHIFIGYQGWITKARQSGHEFVYSTRVMTAEERQAHGLNDSQIGAICELYDMRSAEMWKRIGAAPKPIIGSSKADAGEAMPRGRTRLWVAEKRAIVDAIKKMGVSFGAYTIQPIEGMQWSVSGGEYIASEGALAPTPEQVAEGVYEDIESPVEIHPVKPANGNGAISRPYAPEILLKGMNGKIKDKAGAKADIEALKGQFAGMVELGDESKIILAITGKTALADTSQDEARVITEWLKGDANHVKAEIKMLLDSLVTPAETVEGGE